jgi:hypothetical protein
LLKGVWAEAIAAIKSAKMLVFIGYSFPRTDTFLHQLLHVGLLGNSDLRRVIVVNPDAEVAQYAKSQVFNDVFSSRRLEVLPSFFDHKVCRRIGTVWRELEVEPTL